MKRIIIVLLFLAVLVPAFTQDKPIITVLDFSTDGVSENEMRSIISLLSSALFQTQEFTVIDVSERERLLKELEFSVSDCTDESCLLEVGRMLSAEGIDDTGLCQEAVGDIPLGLLEEGLLAWECGHYFGHLIAGLGESGSHLGEHQLV